MKVVHLHAELKGRGFEDPVSGERPEGLGHGGIGILVFLVGVVILKFKVRFGDIVGAVAPAVAGVVQRIQIERTVSACG